MTTETTTETTSPTKKFDTQYSMEHENVPTAASTVDIRPGWDLTIEYYKPYDGEASPPKIRFAGYIIWRDKNEMDDLEITLDGVTYTAKIKEDNASYFESYEGGLAALNKDVQFLFDEYIGILTVKDQVL